LTDFGLGPLTAEVRAKAVRDREAAASEKSGTTSVTIKLRKVVGKRFAVQQRWSSRANQEALAVLLWRVMRGPGEDTLRLRRQMRATYLSRRKCTELLAQAGDQGSAQLAKGFCVFVVHLFHTIFKHDKRTRRRREGTSKAQKELWSERQRRVRCGAFFYQLLLRVQPSAQQLALHHLLTRQQLVPSIVPSPNGHLNRWTLLWPWWMGPAWCALWRTMFQLPLPAGARPRYAADPPAVCRLVIFASSET
jgi:hypothetical protein